MMRYAEKRPLDFGLVLEPYEPNALHELYEPRIEIIHINQWQNQEFSS